MKLSDFPCESIEEKKQLLALIREAIQNVLIAQRYRIGSHELTRANLSDLMKIRKELQDEIAVEEAGGFFKARVRVPYFDRR